MHHPPFRTMIGHMDEIGLRDPDGALAAVVARHPQVRRVICGHLHRLIQAPWANTIRDDGAVDGAPGVPGSRRRRALRFHDGAARLSGATRGPRRGMSSAMPCRSAGSRGRFHSTRMTVN
jgi:hypothetical protein